MKQGQLGKKGKGIRRTQVRPCWDREVQREALIGRQLFAFALVSGFSHDEMDGMRTETREKPIGESNEHHARIIAEADHPKYDHRATSGPECHQISHTKPIRKESWDDSTKYTCKVDNNDLVVEGISGKEKVRGMNTNRVEGELFI
jgi:hypothetical protein